MIWGPHEISKLCNDLEADRRELHEGATVRSAVSAVEGTMLFGLYNETIANLRRLQAALAVRGE